MSSSHPFSLAALSLSLSHFAAALPPLTLEPLSPSCSSYPSYNPTTQIAGPWPLLSASTGTPIENATASIVSFTNDGKDRYGFITIPKAIPPLGPPPPRLTLRCIADNQLQAQLITPTTSSWVNLSIAADENWQHALAFGLPEEGLPVRPFKHVVNGTGLEGVWLGADGVSGSWDGDGDVNGGVGRIEEGSSTEWAFKHNWGGNAGEYFLVRWRGEVVEEKGKGKRQDPPVVDDRDWVGYLRVG